MAKKIVKNTSKKVATNNKSNTPTKKAATATTKKVATSKKVSVAPTKKVSTSTNKKAATNTKKVATKKVATLTKKVATSKVATPAKKVATVTKKAATKKVAVPVKKTVTVTKKAATKKVAAPVKKAAVPTKKVATVTKKVATKKVAVTATPTKKVATVAKKAVPTKKVATKKAEVAVKKTIEPKKVIPTKSVKEKVEKVVEPKIKKARKSRHDIETTYKTIEAPDNIRTKSTIKNAKDGSVAMIELDRGKKGHVLLKNEIETFDIPRTSLLDDEVDYTRPTFRYSDEELIEFKDLINKRLDTARENLNYYQSLMSRKDESGTNDTDNRFNGVEDGTAALEREQLSQFASRQMQFIDHLEKALIRIENKTYGVCRVTGKLIDKARLRAVPHATLSMEAKNSRI